MVFPQDFNYRLIIASLAVALVATGSYSFYNFNKLEDYKTFIYQEKKLLENELSEMITRFEDVEVENTSINIKLEAYKANIKGALDSIQALQADVTLLTVYRSKIKMLQKEKEVVFNLVYDLQIKNQELTSKSSQIEAKLTSTKALTNSLKIENNVLSKVNTTLSKKIINASQLDIEDLSVNAVKRITNKRIITTNDSKKANKLHIEFTVSKNKFLQEGEKDIYIQILNPNNNIIADQGAVQFGKQSLIYSKKIKVNYKNKDLNIGSLITTDTDEPLTKGVYFVNVFNDNRRIGSTSVTLK